MTMSDSRECLKFRMLGSLEATGSWGHNYVRHLTGEITQEWQDLEVGEGKEKERDDLLKLVHDVVPYLMQHNAEPEACDILMEVEKLEELEQYVDKSAYPRVCLYLRRPQSRQLTYILGRQQIYFDLGCCDQVEEMELMRNVNLNNHFLSIARELHVMEPKYPEDIYKSHLKPHRLLIGQGTVDSARQNLLALFPNGLVNAAVGKDKLLMDDGNTWLYKNKEHGPILLWDINGGLGQLHKYLYSKEDYIKAQEQGWPPERTSRFCAKEALQNPVSILTQTVAKQSVGQLRYGLQALPILSPGAAMSLTQNRCQPDFDDSNFNSNNNTWQCRRCQTMNGSTAARCSTCQDFRFPYGIVPPDSWSDNDYEDGLFMMSRIDPVFTMIKTILAGGFVPSIDGVSCGVISPQQPLPCKVIRVQAVQNLAQFQLYTVQKQLMMNQSPPIAVNEELLWHGTSHAGMLGIVRTNFNRSFVGTNGTRFGRGCYFSKSAVYSADDRFATPTQLKKYQTLILAKILLGNVVLGKKGMNQPPKNYHSAVDDVHQPTKFVIFRDTQMLPTYVVTILKK